jgi:glutamate--cysteine ligase
MDYCFYKSSPKISKIECGDITRNRLETSLYGRKKNLKLIKNSKKIKLKDWGEEILLEMMELAKKMDKKVKDNRYSETIKKQQEKMKDQSLTPSAKVIEDIKKKGGIVKLGLELANKHKAFYKKLKISEKVKEQFIYTAQESLDKKKKLEFEAEYYLRGYEELEVSTQILIRAAIERGIKVEVLDKKDSFISLEKNGKKEYVKQATKTSLDSYITFLIMENKYVSKKVLEEKGIKVPAGDIYYTEEDAISDYPKFAKKKLVVKPNSTNFGIGVAFVNPGDIETFTKKIKDAFTFDKEVIVEEFIDGPEYRFLVIGDKVEGIVHRVPANVIGDGINNIKKLVELKNDQKNIYYIKLGATEKNELKKQKLTLTSIPKKGSQIFLRTNSNVSTGGDALDFTDEIAKKYKKIAVAAAKAANAKICGVDMIINKKNYGIIEINFNPALEMHVFPYKGKKRDLANPVLDLLGFASK